MKRCQRVHSFRGKRGAFTLVEIMVAAAITVIMVGLVIQITGEVLKIWNRSAGKLSASAEARITMELITSDLESAVFRNDQKRWLLALDDVGAPNVAGFDPSTIKLILLTPAQDRPEVDASDNPVPGNICAVEYTLVYQDPVSGDDDDEDDNIYALHRRLIDPVTTFSEILGKDNFESWADDEISVDTAKVNLPPYELPSKPEYYLSGNVVNFSVDFFYVYVDSSSVPPVRELREIPAPVIYGGTGGAGEATIGPQATNPEFRFPIEYADISITVISDEGMEILRNLGENRGGTGFQSGEGKKVVRQYGETYKRRVYFQAKPL